VNTEQGWFLNTDLDLTTQLNTDPQPSLQHLFVGLQACEPGEQGRL
jgi:hypothetical protein